MSSFYEDFISSFQKISDNLQTSFLNISSAMSPSITAAALQEMQDALVRNANLSAVFNLNLHEEIANQMLNVLDNTYLLTHESLSAISNVLLSFQNITANFDYSYLTQTIQNSLEALFPEISFDLIKISDDQIIIPSDTVSELKEKVYLDDIDYKDLSSTGKKLHTFDAKQFLFRIIIFWLPIILPMLQTAYYHKIDSIQSQIERSEDIEYRERLLQEKKEQTKILMELESGITDLLDVLQSFEEFQENTLESEESPYPSQSGHVSAPESSSETDTSVPFGSYSPDETDIHSSVE